MKPTKTVGILAAALVATMATVAPSAMAGNTQLCNQDPAGGTCPSGSAVTHVHFVDPLALLFAEGPFGITKDILCEALFLGTVLGLGAPQVIHGNFTFSAPHGGIGSCFEMEGDEECGEVGESSNDTLRVLKIGKEVAEVSSEGFVLVECAGLHCVYDLTELPFILNGALGGWTGQLSVSAQKLNKVSGFLCPSTSRLTTHSLPLENLYIGT
jgi:hypothetical protein